MLVLIKYYISLRLKSYFIDFLKFFEYPQQ